MPTPNKGPIRVGILGQGRSGLDIHTRWFARSPRKYRIVAVADLLQDRRERAVRELGCDAYADYKKLLERDDIELVVNSLPSYLHPRGTVQALQAGHHVVCEKPLAWSVAELDRMIRAARQARRVLAPYQQSRYAPDFQKLQQILDSGVLGRIVQINICFDGFSRRWDWQTLQEFKGGNLLNTGPHPVDQAVCLQGFKKPDRIVCQMDRANTFGDAEDHVKVLMQARGRPTIDLQISSCCAYAEDRYKVFGTRGGLSGGPAGLRWRYFDLEKAPEQTLTRAPLPGPSYCREDLKWTEKTWKPTQSQQNSFSYMSTCFYNHLYKVLRQDAALFVTPQQVRVQVAVMEECHRQNRLSRQPRQGWPAGD